MQGGPGNFPLIIPFLRIVRKPSEDERSAGKNRAQMKLHLGPVFPGGTLVFGGLAYNAQKGYNQGKVSGAALHPGSPASIL